MADKYAVNYEDERSKNVENETNQRINEILLSKVNDYEF